MIEIDYRRLCRLDGRKPTARERWVAFYRLWRLIRNARPAQSWEDAIECFRVLMHDWRWIELVSDTGDYYESLRFMPLEIRWHKVLHVRGKR